MSLRRASVLPGTALILGYNTAILNEVLNLRKKPFIVNMDGIEWRRRKWSPPAKAWLWVNEKIALRRATYVIADHPAIARHLRSSYSTERIAMIPYGADRVDQARTEHLEALGLTAGQFATIIARPEPENSVVEMVQAFSRRKRGGVLAVLGSYSAANRYQRAVLEAASDQVIFPGPIYDADVLASLRYGSAFYMYGHTVGGTSPTLLEALGAGCTPLCLDTEYSRWVAGDAGVYFANADECDRLISRLFDRTAEEGTQAKHKAYERFERDFTWPDVLRQYESLLAGVGS